MAVLGLLGRFVGVVVLGLVIASFVLVDREQATETIRRPRRRFRAISLHLVLLVAVLLVNRTFRHLGQELSWALGWNITGLIYSIEGEFVAFVQSYATPLLTEFFSLVYLYGYAFLVAFPVVLYVLSTDVTPVRKTLVAYAINYGLGLVLYTLFISYGPRNLLPDAVQPLLYSTRPEAQLLVSTINTNTNVFPSLHTSLSVTVALLARRTRSDYPVWYWIAVPLASSIVLSTLYLGIHWLVDVVAGTLLAILSVRLADRYHGLEWLYETMPWGGSDGRQIRE